MALQTKTITGSTNNSNWTWKMEVIENSTNTSANTSSITINTYIGRASSSSYFAGTASLSINCNGEVRTISKTFPYPTNVSGGGWVFAQGESFTVTHESNGTKSINVSSSLSTTDFTPNSASASGKMDLTTIPRYAEFTTHKINSCTETTVKVDWGCNSACDVCEYSINDGAWKSASGYPTYTVSGLSANTKYNIRTRVRRTDSQLYTTSGKLEFTTYNYPYCTEAPNFTIGNKVTVKFYNPLNRSIQIQMWSHRGSQFVSDLITTSGTSYAGFNNVTDRLYASIPNNTDSRYNIDVHYSGNKAVKEGGTYSIKGTETPTFTNFTYKDNNTDTVNITGNDQVLVKGFSNLGLTISSGNKMTARNSATPKNYVASIDNLSKTIPYSNDDITSDIGVVKSSGNIRLNVRAYDSRNLSTIAYKDITVYDYEKPVINIDVSRLNNFEDETTLKVSGTYTRLTIGGNDKNTLTDLEYRYKEVGGDWTGWTKLNTTISGGKFTCSDVILSLDNTKAFEFQVQATDKLSNNSLTVPLDVGEAIFFISSNKKQCYINGELVKGSTVVSNEEPTDGEEVWLQRGENLYNPKNAYKYSGALQNIYFEYHNVKVGETYVFKTERNWTTIYTYNSAKERVRILGDTMYNYEQSVTIQEGETYFIAFFYAGADTDISTYDFTGIVLEKGKKIMTNKIYTKTYDRYEECCFDSSNIVYGKEKLSDILDNYKRGTTREGTVVGSYVRLFTFEMSGIWKNTSILFYLNDTQNNTFSQLVNMSVKKNGENDELSLHTFKALNFMGSVTSQLVGVVTSKNKIEVYFKMSASQSPTINILSMAKLNENTSFGVITIDCKTVVSSLPSGTQKFVSNMF